jgi:hypothetical protein
MGVAGIKPQGSLDERDRLIDRPGEELTLAEPDECGYPVGIEREHGLVCGNGLCESTLCAQHLAFGVMRETAAG